ncbi:MAG: hypothetical protein WC560_04295 [Syntrophales bacterium]
MFIAAPCPQCGGEIEFLDEVQVVKCQYCGSLLQSVGNEGVRRYYLEPRGDIETTTKALIRKLFPENKTAFPPLKTQLIFYPYWWVKGMVFKWLIGKKNVPSNMAGIPNGWENVKELNTRLFDQTFPANGKTLLGPPTLGIRTETMRVRAFNWKEMEQRGVPLKTTISHNQAIEYAEKLKDSPLGLKKFDVEMERTMLIGERYAMIFAPIWAISLSSPQGGQEILVDGISHSVIETSQKEKIPLSSVLKAGKVGI